MTLEEARKAYLARSKQRKYHNQKVVTPDGEFDSEKEYRRWCELKLLERAGEIRELKRQVPFVVIPVQKDDNGKVIEREVKYIADFTYYEGRSLRRTVEDVKSRATKTREYIIKRKLMLWRNGIRIKEV